MVYGIWYNGVMSKKIKINFKRNCDGKVKVRRWTFIGRETGTWKFKYYFWLRDRAVVL